MLRSLESTQRISPERLREMRLRKLRALVDHAFNNTVFYRKRFQQAGMAPKDIRDFDDLCHLPPLTKSDLVRHQGELIAGNMRTAELHHTATGGSSGTHTPFYRDNRCLDVKRAAEYRCNRWCGWEVGQKIAVVWPAFQDLCERESWKQKLRQGLVDRQRMFYSGELNEARMSELARRLHQYAPVLIRAFPYPLAVTPFPIRWLSLRSTFAMRHPIVLGPPAS
jgi:phenylacetate-CoA ligase